MKQVRIMSNKFFILFLVLFGFKLSFAAVDVQEPVKMKWPFEGIFGTFDRQSAQRGYQVYKDVCASCHSMKKIAYRNLSDIGFSQDYIKELASQIMVEDGPDDSGEMFDRPGVLSDYLPSPYPNKQAAMASNSGAYPPDLSLIVKARKNGPNYLYSLLTGYTSEEADEGGLYENPYFEAGKLAMAPPLSEDIVSYADGTPATVQNMAYDVVNFLQWGAEIEMEQRKRMGIKIISFLIIMLIVMIKAKNIVWSNLK